MTLTAPASTSRQAEMPDVVVPDVREADVRGADVAVADVRGADVREADVAVADFVAADVREADVAVADFVAADVRGADVREADVCGPALAAVAVLAPVDSAFSRALTALAEVSVSLETLRSIDDDALIVATRRAAAERQLVDTHAALIAGEVARRSQHALGSSGLAQRLGYRTTEELVRTTTGSTARDAFTAVRVGRLLSDTKSEGNVDPLTGVIHEVTEPWLAPVAAALLANELSVSAAESIRSGLGRPNDTITSAQLRDAAQQLCIVGRRGSTPADPALAASGIGSGIESGSGSGGGDGDGSGTDADRLHRLARELREELDLDAVAVHEEIRRAQRSLTLRRQPDGMTRLVWLMDPETAAIGTELYDRLTSPRGAGPRFVDLDSAVTATPAHNRTGRVDNTSDTGATMASLDSQTIDMRSSAQLASDVFLELLRHGADADSSKLLGGGAPVIRVLVTRAALRAGRGAGHIEGQTAAISINTVERLACAGSTSDISFDENAQPLNVGREQRMFTRAQRIALAARDGGCRFGDCERPPSWCEAHHVAHWDRDHGGTDIANGILLCRHHHLLLHNNGWEISQVGAEYSLIPPGTVDAAQQPRLMPSKSAAYRQLQRN